VFYNYLSRPTLTKESFLYIRSSSTSDDEFIEVNIEEILEEQLQGIVEKYNHISNILIEMDKKHKEKHKEKLVVDIFPSSISYSFQKVAQAIYSPGGSNIIFGAQMLESIDKTYRAFEKELLDRNELQGNEGTQYDLDQYFHAINTLRTYFNGQSEDMTERDARVYHYFIEKEHAQFVKLAEEYDEAYKN